MRAESVPATGPRYWAAMGMASVFGANMGDFVSHDLHGGHWRGLPVLALGLAATLAVERLSHRARTAWYWLAVIVVRTAATNLADLATHDGQLGYGVVSGALAALLAATILLRRRLGPDPVTGGVPRVDGSYWFGMLVAGTLGTAMGDGLADTVGLPAAALTGAVAG